MQSVIDFIQAYWAYISAGILILIEVLILFLKKRPKTLSDFLVAVTAVCAHLPVWINEYEGPGNGENKKAMVISQAIYAVEKKLGRHLDSDEIDTVSRTFSEQIEKILSTPQKKGAQNA